MAANRNRKQFFFVLATGISQSELPKKIWLPCHGMATAQEVDTRRFACLLWHMLLSELEIKEKFDLKRTRTGQPACKDEDTVWLFTKIFLGFIEKQNAFCLSE
jgi:hypothetical protein